MACCGCKFKKDLVKRVGMTLKYEETSMFGSEYKADGSFCLVGPSSSDRKWFAEVTMRNGIIQEVR